MFGLKGNRAGLRAEAERWLFEATLVGEADAFETSKRVHVCQSQYALAA